MKRWTQFLVVRPKSGTGAGDRGPRGLLGIAFTQHSIRKKKVNNTTKKESRISEFRTRQKCLHKQLPSDVIAAFIALLNLFLTVFVALLIFMLYFIIFLLICCF